MPLSPPWKISKHTTADKSFTLKGPLDLEVDFDDVNHGAVDIVAAKIVDVLNRHYYPPKAQQCEREECDNAFRPIPVEGDFRCKSCRYPMNVLELRNF